MGKTKKIISILIIGLLRRSSQIIFSVLYNPTTPQHLGLTTGPWTQHITMTGFELQQLTTFINSKPSPIVTGKLEEFNQTCKYGL